MSKNRSNKPLMQHIREQQHEIERLRFLNKEMNLTLNEMRLNGLHQFTDVITCVFEQFMMDAITEEQAGQMMVALVGAMQSSRE